MTASRRSILRLLGIAGAWLASARLPAVAETWPPAIPTPPPGVPRPDTMLALGGQYPVLKDNSIWQWLPDEQRWEFKYFFCDLDKIYVRLRRSRKRWEVRKALGLRREYWTVDGWVDSALDPKDYVAISALSEDEFHALPLAWETEDSPEAAWVRARIAGLEIVPCPLREKPITRDEVAEIERGHAAKLVHV